MRLLRNFGWGNRATALSVVVIIIFALFFLGLAIVAKLTTGSRLAAMEKIETTTLYLAEAGLQRAIWQLQSDPDWSDNTPPSDLYTDEELDNGAYTVTLSDRNKSDIEIASTGKIVNSSRTIIAHLTRQSQHIVSGWWNLDYSYRINLTVNNSSANPLPVGYSVMYLMDTASLVSANKMKSDGTDLRVIRKLGNQWQEIDRDIIDMNSDQTRVWFSIQKEIPAGGSDGDYWLYYGNTNASAPLADKDKVYYFQDDFNRPDSSSLGEKWSNPIGLSTCRVRNNQADFRTGGDVDEGYITARMGPIRDFMATYRVYINKTEGSLLFRSNEARLPAYLNRMQIGKKKSTAGVFVIRLTNTWQAVGTDKWTPRTRRWYNIKLIVLDNTLQCYVDDVRQLNETDNRLDRSGTIGFYLSRGANAYYDDVIVRMYQEPEPTVGGIAEEKIIDHTQPVITHWEMVK